MSPGFGQRDDIDAPAKSKKDNETDVRDAVKRRVACRPSQRTKLKRRSRAIEQHLLEKRSFSKKSLRYFFEKM